MNSELDAPSGERLEGRRLEGHDGGLTALATRRPVGVTMVALSVVLFGWISFGLLPRNLMPDISYPSVTVRTTYPGAAPIDVEMRVSRRLEEVLSQVRNIRRVSSISRAEVSDVILEFAWGTEMSLATTEVREKVSQASLPEEADKPTFLRYDPTLDPILQIGLLRESIGGRSPEESLIDLRVLAELELEQAMESVPGVAGVRIRGGLEQEIRIDVDESQLQAKGVDMSLIVQRIRDENLNQASGILYEGEQARVVRTVNEFKDLDEVRNLILRRDGTIPVMLADVAKVSFGYKDPEVITRIAGKPCVKIEVFKEADANIVEVAQRVRDRLFGTEQERGLHKWLKAQDAKQAKAPESDPAEAEDEKSSDDGEAASDTTDESKKAKGDEAKKAGGGMPSIRRPDFLVTRLPTGVGAEVMSDQSLFIRDSLEDVRRTVLSGGVLAILVLYVFLRSLRFTIAVGLSIPLSVMATFIALHMAGVSLNMMSLGGLALGIGMLVDNSVVVLESIFRCREEGDGPEEAAIRGTSLVSSAVIASTLTTVAVFFPIVFVEGVAGQIFRDQALAVVISLIASLAAALYFIPSLVARSMGREKRKEAEQGGGREPLARWLKLGLRFSSWSDLLRSFKSLKKRWYFAPFIVVIAPIVFVLRFAGELSFVVLVWCGLYLLRLWRWVTKPFRSSAGFVNSKFLGLFDVAFDRLRLVYRSILSAALNARLIVVVASVLIAIPSFSLFSELETELIPVVHQGEFTVDVRLPRSTRIEETNRIVEPWERRLLSDEFPEIARVTTTIGVEKDELSGADEGEHSAKILVRLKPGGDLDEKEREVKRRIRGLVRDAEFESVELINPVLFSFKTPIEVEVSGYDLKKLSQVTGSLVQRMEAIAEIKDVKSSVARGNPEVQVKLDRELLSRLDLGVGQIGNVVRQKVQGEIPSYYTLNDRKVAMRVRLTEKDRDSLEELRNLSVHTKERLDLRLRDVVQGGEVEGANIQTSALVIGEGPAEIRRIGHQRAGVVTANLAGMSLGSATEQIESAIESVDAPPEFTIDFGGQKQEMDQALGSLTKALLLAVFLVYVVMAMQFESLVQPLIIIVSIPLAMVGVLPVLWFLEKPLSIVVFIGMIVLAGIVVNNAIVLVDTANQFVRSGLSARDSILRAGEMRLRPILMTTLTTVLGLLPLTGLLAGIDALTPFIGSGQGEEIRAPLAITVISGLIASTVLTLLVIPVIASLVYSGRDALRES